MGNIYGTIGSNGDTLTVVGSYEDAILKLYRVSCTSSLFDCHLNIRNRHTFGIFISMAGGLKDWNEKSVIPFPLLQMKVELDTSPCIKMKQKWFGRAR